MERWKAVTQMEGLVTLLLVVREGRLDAAAEELQVNRTTVTRRLKALEAALGGRVVVRGPAGMEVTPLGEKALAAARALEAAVEPLTGRHRGDLHGVIRLGVPEAFAVAFAAPSIAELQTAHPRLQVQIRTNPARGRTSHTDLDMVVTVGHPGQSRALTRFLRDYELRLYASEDYVRRHGAPQDLADLGDHPLVYYVETELSTESLDAARESLRHMRTGASSTSVMAQVAATRAGAGIGLLPDFCADDDPDLVPILPNVFHHRMEYWLMVTVEAWRNPTVRAVHERLALHQS